MSEDSTAGPGGDDGRLESWKEIAAYLRRDVRTVQRWEQTDGLPVHRHKRAQRPIPYAYRSELDAWWVSRSEASPAYAAAAPLPAVHETASPRQYAIAAATLIALAVMGAAIWMARPRSAAAHPSVAAVLPAKAVGVLPFVDLTEGMKEEEFADGMTEELIDRLNKVPGFRSPAPTSTFYFKNKHVPIPEIARTLRVSYLLDGSIRKSGDRLRVAARLIRADDANVVWSETYDRPWSDMLVVQDDIASEVTKALAASIDAASVRERSH